jgi:hypothetical protein
LKKESLPAALQKWEDYSKERVQQMLEFTKLTARLRKAMLHWLLEVIREWAVWLILILRGPEAYRWLYGYDAEIAMSKL